MAGRSYSRPKKRGKASVAKRLRDKREKELKMSLLNNCVPKDAHTSYRYKNHQKALQKLAEVNSAKAQEEIPSTSAQPDVPHTYSYDSSAFDFELKPNIENIETKEGQFCNPDANLYQHGYVQQPMDEAAGPSTRDPLGIDIAVSSIKNETFVSEVGVSFKQEPLESEISTSFIKEEPLELPPSEHVIKIDVDILIDGEKKFLLSLLPHVCSLTVEQKVHFQTKTIELLNDIVKMSNQF